MSGTDQQEMSCKECSYTKDVPATGSRALSPCPTCHEITEFQP